MSTTASFGSASMATSPCAFPYPPSPSYHYAAAYPPAYTPAPPPAYAPAPVFAAVTYHHPYSFTIPYPQIQAPPPKSTAPPSPAQPYDPSIVPCATTSSRAPASGYYPAHPYEPTWPPPAPNTHPTSGVELPTRTVQNQRPTAAPPPGCYYTTACPYAASYTDPERAPWPDHAPAPTREPHRPLQLTPTDYRLESTAPPTPVPPTTGAPASSATPTTTLRRRPDHGPGAPLSTDLCSPTASPSASSDSSQFDSASIAFVAPQVLGEMPTPNFLQETHGTDPSKCSGHQNPIQITCVSNLSEQNLDQMPQVYGLHNLNRHSMLLADGTEHSFYALPENYPLERATPSPVFDACADETDGWSTEIVHVLADLPEQHRHEQEQHESAQPTKCSKANNTANFESMLVNNLQVPTTMQDASSVFKEMPVYDIYEDDNSCLNCMDEQLATPFHKASENALSEQLLTCFSKAPETEQTSACLNIVTDVLDVTLELQQLDGEKASNCPVLKASDSYVTMYNQLSTVHRVKKLRLLWDPGATELPTLFSTAVGATELQGTDNKKEFLSLTTSEPVFDVSANEKVGYSNAFAVFATFPDQQQKYEEDQQDRERLAKRFHKASDNAFSEEATDFTCSHGPIIHAERSIKLTNEKSTQAASILSIHEAIMHCHDERSELNIKNQDVLINKHNITYSCDLNNDKEVPFVLHYQLPLSSTPCIWDPGIDLFSYNKLHLVSWIPHAAILLLQQLHNKNISSTWEFSLGKGRQVQWDPGIELLLYELWWLQTLSKWTQYAMRHLLFVKFFIETAAIMCCPLPNLIQQRRNVAVVLHSWRSIFHDRHYRQIFQKCKAMSSQFHWHEDIKFNGIAFWLITFNPPKDESF